MKDTEKETKGGDAGVKAHCDALVLSATKPISWQSNKKDKCRVAIKYVALLRIYRKFSALQKMGGLGLLGPLPLLRSIARELRQALPVGSK